MKRLRKNLWIGILMAAAGGAALAQGTTSAAPSTAATAPSKEAAQRSTARNDPERFKQRMTEQHAKRMASLKTKLQLRAEQDGAWTTFSNAMQPPASRANWMSRGELEKLSTPERIDQMNSQMTQRQELVRQRGEATKAFYAVLDAEQKKIFDKEMLNRQRREPQRRR